MTRILVVDDDPDFCEIARLVLTEAGYGVDTAGGADAALDKVRTARPDLVLLDVMMRGILDGVYVAHAIADETGTRHLPVVMVSSIADSPASAMFPTGEYLPIDAWISKPASPDVLLTVVRRLIGPPVTSA